MKKAMISIGVIVCTSNVFGQVGINSAVPNPSSNLTVAPTDLKGQYKGTLLSPMTTSQINSIANPAKGLIVYDTLLKCLKVNKGTSTASQWVCLKTRS
ncbi:hypothetical protein SAMN05421594_2611 [Chryseobacterium oleae]|uniref:Uncharacterized protein n=1 Tax=Chryseobacterium oleae TaxID=491207 RepID=A0A1I4YQV3_CHROL|nr:hypothetical protein [Chryseobacterium oleae]SFN40347.1 hypothetical protein SAMN05421594_2611 [Chryseobacterium oleae]